MGWMYILHLHRHGWMYILGVKCLMLHYYVHVLHMYSTVLYST